MHSYSGCTEKLYVDVAPSVVDQLVNEHLAYLFFVRKLKIGNDDAGTYVPVKHGADGYTRNVQTRHALYIKLSAKGLVNSQYTSVSAAKLPFHPYGEQSISSHAEGKVCYSSRKPQVSDNGKHSPCVDLDRRFFTFKCRFFNGRQRHLRSYSL